MSKSIQELGRHIGSTAADALLRYCVHEALGEVKRRVLIRQTSAIGPAEIIRVEDAAPVPEGFIDVRVQTTVYRRIGTVVISRVNLKTRAGSYVYYFVDTPGDGCRFPLRGSRWWLKEDVRVTKKTPSWAKWGAVGTALFTFGLGLVLLGYKDTVATGYLTLTIEHDSITWNERIPVGSMATVSSVRYAVATLVSMS